MNAHGAMYVAMKIVSDLSIKEGVQLIMQPSKTVEVKNGWAFFYTSLNSARTGIPDDASNNAGLILVRRDGSTAFLPATMRWEDLMDVDNST